MANMIVATRRNPNNSIKEFLIANNKDVFWRDKASLVENIRTGKFSYYTFNHTNNTLTPVVVHMNENWAETIRDRTTSDNLLSLPVLS